LKIGKAQLHKMINVKMGKCWAIFQLIAVFLFNSFVYAQEGSAPVVTEEVATVQTQSASESTYEEKLKRWQSLSEEERQKIRERARRLSPEQIKDLREKSEKFRNLPQEEQSRIKNNYLRFKELAPEKRRVLRERSERFQKLLPGKRAELQRKFREKKEGSAVDLKPTRPSRGQVPPRTPDLKEDIRERKEYIRDRKGKIKDRREVIRDRGPGLDRNKELRPKAAPHKGELRAPRRAPRSPGRRR